MPQEKYPEVFSSREGRPTDKETLSARLIDRPIRSLCYKEFPYETMVTINVLSSDQENDSDILGINWCFSGDYHFGCAVRCNDCCSANWEKLMAN